MKIYVHNTQTGKVVERDMTEAEMTQWEIDQADNEAAQLAVSKAQADKSHLLAKLGITDDEAKLLLS
jgi:hypothetical protein